MGGMVGQSGTASRRAEMAQQIQLQQQQDAVDQQRAVSAQDDLLQQTNQLARLYGTRATANLIGATPISSGLRTTAMRA